MNGSSVLDVIKKYAPVLHFCEDEPFLPEDAVVAVKESNLCHVSRNKIHRKSDLTSLDDLPVGPESKKYFLNIPFLDMTGCVVDKNYAHEIKSLGTEAVSELAALKLSNNPHAYPRRFETRLPKYYWRQRAVKILKGDNLFDNYFLENDKSVYGTYTVLQYFYYYVFNDSWNKHEGDWDSVVEIYLNGDTGRRFIVTYMHHSCMAAELELPAYLPDWIALWNQSPKDRLPPAFCVPDSIDSSCLHPNIFIAKGAHGGYPTPGFTLHGIDEKIVKLKILPKVVISNDARQIAKIVVMPKLREGNVSRDLLESVFKGAGLSESKMFFYEWTDPEELKSQRWLDYRGKWGEDSELEGWKGPQGPKNKWRMNSVELKKTLLNAYNAGLPLGTLREFQWHGWHY